MCGILGAFSETPPSQAAFYDTFFDALQMVRYRGPDGSGYLSGKSSPLFFDRDDGLHGEKLEVRRFEVARYLAHGVADGPCVLMGHRRLSIIDLSTAASQPMTIPSRQGGGQQDLSIVYNGEIYNYIEVRAELEKIGVVFTTHSDTEVLLRAYEQWGVGCFEKFNGMWAIALWDDREKKLVLSRDRLGVKPLYYTVIAGQLVFGSEIKQLLKFRKAYNLSTSRNSYRLYEFLSQAVEHHSEETFYEGIYAMRPAHCVVLSPGEQTQVRAKARPYWNFPSEEDVSAFRHVNFSEASLELRGLLESAVALRLRSDVPVGSALSGGIDSSTIVSIISRLKPQRQKTFSAVFEGFWCNEQRFAEAVIAEAAAEGREIEGIMVRPNGDQLLTDVGDLIFHNDGPVWSTSSYCEWEIYKSARAHGVTVMLDGQGSDELFGGYEAFFKSHIKGLLKRAKLKQALTESALLAKNHPSFVSFKRIRGKLSKPFDWLACFSQASQAEIQERQSYIAKYGDEWLLGSSERKYCDPLREALYRSSTRYPLPALLMFSDRDSMAFSVESRTPFLDYRIVEFAYKCPSEFHIRGGMRKALLRSAIEGLVPEVVRGRKDKLGFETPEDYWRKTHFDKFTGELLLKSDDSVLNGGYLSRMTSKMDSAAEWRVLAAILAASEMPRA